MARTVPLNKCSKKVQKEYHARRRGSWYGVRPITLTTPKAKAYDRNRTKREVRGALRET